MCLTYTTRHLHCTLHLQVTHCRVPLSDGCQLALRLWGPSGSLSGLGEPWGLVQGQGGREGSFPAVLEYLPYRKADWTAARDHRQHNHLQFAPVY